MALFGKMRSPADVFTREAIEILKAVPGVTNVEQTAELMAGRPVGAGTR